VQFIKGGPNIPERLLQAHEDGQVVFFCGAGISCATGLPGFDGLVTLVYDQMGESPDPTERLAMKSKQYDTALGLLESRVVGGRDSVRRAIAVVLSEGRSDRDATDTHEALLTLARNRDGRLRVVTTNFDRLFEKAAEDAKQIFPRIYAPLLPVPKSRLDGLVYLHGLIPMTLEGDALDCLVVSSGDFGLAYLTERWASRFVAELFRHFTICFVGYSINDPVMRYMMDALAADKQRGESSIEVFAFAHYEKGKRPEREEEWAAKNVTPILYASHAKHHYLRRTLRVWADLYKDGVSGKEAVVLRHASASPLGSTSEDDYVGRVLWALSDATGIPAQRFADLEPPPSLEWLRPLEERRLGCQDLSRFGVSAGRPDSELAFSLMRRPAPCHMAPFMALVCSETDSVTCDSVMENLARWLARHVGQSELILWIARNGGRLHPTLALAQPR
jgi:hypothetical protein